MPDPAPVAPAAPATSAPPSSPPPSSPAAAPPAASAPATPPAAPPSSTPPAEPGPSRADTIDAYARAREGQQRPAQPPEPVPATPGKVTVGGVSYDEANVSAALAAQAAEASRRATLPQRVEDYTPQRPPIGRRRPALSTSSTRAIRLSSRRSNLRTRTGSPRISGRRCWRSMRARRSTISRA
jgi:hypothetical protein